ncbi:MAG: alpha/beta fold hydrolase [Hyphomicrobiales bacterium]|nr:alpha/beta fold hydrolase [Hyphomicrobiales bacterium]
MSVEIEKREHRTKLGATGLDVFMRNKRPKGVAHFGPDRTLLFVHGATYPASVAFDLPIDGASWMDHIAARGFDVWLMDLPGYGGSSRPKEMSGAPDGVAPPTTTDVAIASVGAVVDFIRRERSLDALCLMGWSWGTALMAGYTQQNPALVKKLALFAPLWIIKGGQPVIGDASGTIGAWRKVTREEAHERWLRRVPEDGKTTLIPPGVFDDFWTAALASDPEGAAMDPPCIRAPNGVLLDAQRYWMQAKPTWDPAKIECPVLIAMGEWDADTPTSMAQTIFPQLTRAKSKRLVLLGRGTHTMALESERHALFAEVQRFLEE